LLRLYWYDAAVNRTPTPEQLSIADLSDTKIRFGQLNARREQKRQEVELGGRRDGTIEAIRVDDQTLRTHVTRLAGEFLGLPRVDRRDVR
jgi:hypothetical protein